MQAKSNSSLVGLMKLGAENNRFSIYGPIFGQFTPYSFAPNQNTYNIDKTKMYKSIHYKVKLTEQKLLNFVNRDNRGWSEWFTESAHILSYQNLNEDQCSLPLCVSVQPLEYHKWEDWEFVVLQSVEQENNFVRK